MAFRNPHENPFRPARQPEAAPFTPTPLASLFPLDNPPPRQRLPIDDFLDFGSDPEVLALNDLDKAKRRHLGNPPSDSKGPSITFENDVEGNTSPNQPISNATAQMIEDAVRATGLSININSTTGGEHAPASRHYTGQAVDINAVGGKPVSSDNAAARTFQDALSKHPNVRENFGPFRNEKTMAPQENATPQPKHAPNHKNHIHVSGQE